MCGWGGGENLGREIMIRICCVKKIVFRQRRKENKEQQMLVKIRGGKEPSLIANRTVNLGSHARNQYQGLPNT